MYLFEPEHLVSLLALFFDDVTCFGLEGDDVLQGRLRGAPRERRAAAASSTCSTCASACPRRAYVWAYEHVLPLVYRVLGSDSTGIGSGIDESHFFLTERHRRRHAGAVRGRARTRASARSRREAGERMTKVWVTVPTLDEVENIDALVRRVRAAVPDAHILVVDDGSADGTAEKAEALGAELGGIEVLRRPRKMGLGSAYRAGHAIGIARGYDVMVQIDADLSHDPAALPRPARRGRAGADLAIGSRYVPGGAVPELAQAPACCSRCGATATPAFALGLRRARLHRRLPRVPRVDPAGDGHRVDALDRLRVPDRDDVPASLNAGGRIDEVPITFTDRVRGTSKMSSRIVAEAMTLVTLWAFATACCARRQIRREGLKTDRW